MNPFDFKLKPATPPPLPSYARCLENTRYRPEYARIAKQMCSLGASDADLARAFGVMRATVLRWMSKFPDFHQAVKIEGVPAYNSRIERALAMRAMGYEQLEERVALHEGRKIRIREMKYYPPDARAALKFLEKRDPDRWGVSAGSSSGDQAFVELWKSMK